MTSMIQWGLVAVLLWIVVFGVIRFFLKKARDDGAETETEQDFLDRQW